MSAGFLVVLFVALGLVVVPSMIALVAGWRRRGLARLAAILGGAVICSIAVLFLAPSEWPSTYEERVVIFLAAWGMVFLACAGIASMLLPITKLVARRNQTNSKSQSTQA
jgi:predicted phage tail protein